MHAQLLLSRRVVCPSGPAPQSRSATASFPHVVDRARSGDRGGERAQHSEGCPLGGRNGPIAATECGQRTAGVHLAVTVSMLTAWWPPSRAISSDRGEPRPAACPKASTLSLAVAACARDDRQKSRVNRPCLLQVAPRGSLSDGLRQCLWQEGRKRPDRASRPRLNARSSRYPWSSSFSCQTPGESRAVLAESLRWPR